MGKSKTSQICAKLECSGSTPRQSGMTWDTGRSNLRQLGMGMGRGWVERSGDPVIGKSGDRKTQRALPRIYTDDTDENPKGSAVVTPGLNRVSLYFSGLNVEGVGIAVIALRRNQKTLPRMNTDDQNWVN
jgi:hypothetical protein